MKTIVYGCMLVDAITALFLVFTLFSSGQDSAGKGMVFLPILALIACAVGAYFLLGAGHAGWALTVSGFPVIIIAYLAFISFT
ncbi:hypothetical protein LZD49_26110 [Dyadobacter sp. CY261]|uniref:hypothetical protein n=1 Tax=Dyadobacter sp. CY261 TaxID=2907203 RepID=UPI001F2928CE|nr:hypothetical protein [Dyadobacter sp. CY261]MCF0073983.1 hypothetical protein [Dyadobacter sp. CY261]